MDQPEVLFIDKGLSCAGKKAAAVTSLVKVPPVCPWFGSLFCYCESQYSIWDIPSCFLFFPSEQSLHVSVLSTVGGSGIVVV